MEQKTMATGTSISIPEGIQVAIEGSVVKVKGGKGEEQRVFPSTVKGQVRDQKVMLSATLKGKKAKKQLGTWKSHIRNLMKGVSEGHVYTMKTLASHFPMTVTVENNKVTVKNFMGEKVPREIAIPEGVSVKVEGQKITIESNSKERAGNMAAALEQLTHRANYDKRIFQDGIYITSKDGKAIA